MINVTAVSLIQELRAIHALSELSIKIIIHKSDEIKFQPLRDRFNMDYSIGYSDGINISEILTVDHSQPSTSLLNVVKPLIFPKAITNHLKARWSDNRRYKFAFTGFLTVEREKVIENWLLSVLGKDCSLKSEPILYRAKRKLYLKLNIRRLLLKKFGDLYISSSIRGRIFPAKSWDDDYYNFLLRSNFVLCPSGVHVWTYRFFESILCGAIPIVEKHSPCYTGFKYYTMTEDVKNIKWSKEIAEYNFNLCLERITLSEVDVQNIQVLLKKFIPRSK